MKEIQQKLKESDYTENDSTFMVNEKVLILPMTEPKRNLDQTISNPDRYINGKRMFNHYPASGGNPLPIITFMAAIGVAIYVLLNNL
jgi:hypothetical protein